MPLPTLYCGLEWLKIRTDNFIARPVIKTDHQVLQLLWCRLSLRIVCGTVSRNLGQPRRAIKPHKFVVGGIDHLDATRGHVRAFVGLDTVEDDSRLVLAIVALDVERQLAFPFQQSYKAGTSGERR